MSINKQFYSTYLLITVTLIASCFNGQEGRIKNFKAQLGTYVLDINKTILGVYAKDSNIYREVRITFNSDSTFKMNRQVPFMYDSVGWWVAGNMKEWNYLCYKKWGNKGCGNENGDQFIRPYMDSDSRIYFIINSVTPQRGAQFLQEIYFRKIIP